MATAVLLAGWLLVLHPSYRMESRWMGVGGEAVVTRSPWQPDTTGAAGQSVCVCVCVCGETLKHDTASLCCPL